MTHSGNVGSDKVESLEDSIIKYSLEFLEREVVSSYEDDHGQFSLEEDVIINTCEEEFEPLSSDQHEGDLDIELDSFHFYVHLDSLTRETKYLIYDKRSCIGDLA